MFKKAKIESGYTLLELIYVVSIITVLVCLLAPNLLAQKQRFIQLSAQRRLRTIGAVMTDYALSNEGNYADFRELKDSNMIKKEVTASNIIIDYSLIVKTTTSESMGNPPLFTIIAMPRPERMNSQLATFAITEDQVVRVYKEGEGVIFNDPQTWEPVL